MPNAIETIEPVMSYAPSSAGWNAITAAMDEFSGREIKISLIIGDRENQPMGLPPASCPTSMASGTKKTGVY